MTQQKLKEYSLSVVAITSKYSKHSIPEHVRDSEGFYQAPNGKFGYLARPFYILFSSICYPHFHP